MCPVSTVTSLQDAGMQLHDHVLASVQLPEFWLMIAPSKTPMLNGELFALTTVPNVHVAV